MSQGPDFTKTTKDVLARRAGQICSNPECRRRTSSPHTEKDKAMNLGEAAHIRAARKGQARYDPNMTDEERRNISNGIWLCKECARIIDLDKSKFTVDLLYRWKKEHEDYISAGKPQIENRKDLPQLSSSKDIDFSPPTYAEEQAGSKRSWFIRLKVENTGQAVAVNCIGRLMKVLDESGRHLKQFDSLNLYWSRQDRPNNYKPLDIHKLGDYHYLDIAQIKEVENTLTLRAVIPTGHRLVATPEHTGPPECLPSGIYFVQIAIYADNASINPTWFEIKWTDDYSVIPHPCDINMIEKPRVLLD